MTQIKIIRLLENPEIYAMHKMVYGYNGVIVSVGLFTSREHLQARVDNIVSFLQKNDMQVTVSWHYLSGKE